MKANHKGLLKTGVMAVVATLVFVAFIFRAGDWARGLNSEFVVYGQSGGPVTTVTKIIPHIALGSYDFNTTKYVTTIQIVNAGTAAVTVSASFFNEGTTGGAAAGSPATYPMTASVAGAEPTLLIGSLPSVSVPPNKTLVIIGAGGAVAPLSAPGYYAVWGRITSSAAVTISTVFDYRRVTGDLLYGRTGVGASDADMKRFVIPRSRNTTTGQELDTGFAIVNTGTTSADLVGTVYDANGAVIKTKTQTFAGGQHIAAFAQQFFALTGEPSGATYGSIVFSSTAGQFAAVALSIEGGNISTVPVDRLQ